MPNTTLRMPESPPAFGFRTENAFGSLDFSDPVALVTPPGETNRLFVVEQAGRISVITNLANPTRTVFMDISSQIVFGGEQGLLGLAFHPGYATNRYFYAFYTLNTTTAPGGGLHDRLSRFEISPTNPNQGLANSGQPLITQRDDAGNHNGGDLHFGPDGYLYISLGDEGAGNDSLNNSQRITKDFFSGMLRIDVDKRPGNLEPNPHSAISTNATGLAFYAVPADNPFIGVTNFNGNAVDPSKVHTEFWAVGLRNPWRFSIDPVTGVIYCGDVGQDTREEIDIIVKGGNYGWNFREGKIARPGSPAPPAGFTSINPIHDYPRSLGFSVTGGVVYRGNRFAQIYGDYIFADYGSGNLWALRYDGINPAAVRLLMVEKDISAFGVDPSNGDILICDIGEDVIKRLSYNSTNTGSPLPPTLVDTGAFSDLAALTPHPGIVPYDINLPFWSDGAHKSRWFSLPDTNLTIGFEPEGNWATPAGAIWIKNFELQLTNGVPESARRLETRFIVRNADGVYGVTYRWDSMTNATLVPEEGMEEPISISDNGVVRTQIWHYPSRSECLACHTRAGGLALGFNTPQMNREMNYSGVATNQIQALSDAGYFQTPLTGFHTLRALAPATDATTSLDYRVHSYLAANCVQCHQPGGSAIGFWDARITTPLSSAGLIDGLLSDYKNDPGNRVIKPGSTAQSMLLTRISSPGPGRMPPIATRELDQQAIALVTDWITQGLANYESFAAWQARFFNSTNAPAALPDADPDADGASNYLEYLTGSNPMATGDNWKVSIHQAGAAAQISFPQIANRGFQLQFDYDLTPPIAWEPLEVPANRLFFSATNLTAVIEDSVTNSPTKFYRVRVFEP
ncbi:MAG: PQQ-dependent sugar dehydrogenase [Verrucomicrobiota bacterium]